MLKISSLFHDRKIALYYSLFFAGAFVVAYQAFEWKAFGDSVDLICLFFFLSGFSIRTRFHVLENTALITAGYILPLLIRNALKLSYVEAPSKMAFVELGLRSLTITLLLGLIFSSVGFALKFFATRFYQKSRGGLTTRSSFDKE